MIRSQFFAKNNICLTELMYQGDPLFINHISVIALSEVVLYQVLGTQVLEADSLALSISTQSAQSHLDSHINSNGQCIHRR